jgi:activating signal cointegrator 1
VKALTVRQPWAQLIALGEKTIETRTRLTSHRGLLAIHAGIHPPPKCHRCNGTGMPGPEGDACDVCAGDGIDTIGDTHGEELVYGAIVAVVDLVDCVPMVDSTDEAPTPCIHVGSSGLTLWDAPDWDGEANETDLSDQSALGVFRAGRYGWILQPVYAENGPLPLALPEPVPCRGAQGLWTVPADVEAAVRAQLAAAVAS